MDIGKLISERRKALGLTLEDIGKVVGVSKSTVQKWEKGYISNMKRDKIAALSKILDISPVSFITGELTPLESVHNADITEKQKAVTSHAVIDKDNLPTKDNVTISMYMELDDEDKAEIRGMIRQMLKADKYSGKTVFDDIAAEMERDRKRAVISTK